MDFASCNKCEEVYSCNSRNGTRTLSKHSAKCGEVICLSNLFHPKGQALMTEFIMKKSKPTSTKEREKVTKACAQDFRPFNSVGCDGLVNLVQQCIDIASKSHGHILAQDLLPSPSPTVSQNVETVKDLVVNSLSEALLLSTFKQ